MFQNSDLRIIWLLNSGPHEKYLTTFLITLDDSDKSSVIVFLGYFQCWIPRWCIPERGKELDSVEGIIVKCWFVSFMFGRCRWEKYLCNETLPMCQ